MFRELFRHSIVYGIANSLQNAVSFFLLPLYTAYLTVNEYGILEICIVTITILFNLFQLGLGSALFKYYSYTETSDKKLQRNKLIISSSFYFLLAFAALITFVFYMIRAQISQILFESAAYSNFIVIILIAVFFQMFIVIPKSYLRIQNKSVLFSLLTFSQFVIQLSLLIYIVVGLNGKIFGVLVGRAITAGIFATLFVLVIKNQLISKFSLSVVKELLSYSIYLVPVSVCILILMMSNRYFILFFRDSEELGIFSVGNRISMLILLAVSSFQMAWPSIMFRIREKAQAKEYYSRIFVYFIFIFSFLTLSLTFFSGELILLLSNHHYISAIPLIPILGASYLLYGLFYVGTVGINIYKKTYYQTIAMIIGAGVNVLLNFILTPKYGIIGTSIALCISFAIVGISAFIFSQRIYFVPIEWGRIGRFLSGIITALFLGLYIGLEDINIFNSILKASILLIGLPGWMYISGILTKHEKEIIVHQISHYVQAITK